MLCCPDISDTSILPLLVSVLLRIAEDLGFLGEYLMYDGLINQALLKFSLLLNIQAGFDFVEISVLISSSFEVFN